MVEVPMSPYDPSIGLYETDLRIARNYQNPQAVLNGGP